jgi:3D-(3,5/4)-trihydroxycyclohexane-1,2-dione acylhydrolase (decyclizing)
MPDKIERLTMAQALVRFLRVQHTARDGTVRRLIPGVFGIFGHGNVHGLGQALFEYGEGMPYYRPCNEQSMVHTAAAFARTNLRLATLACASSIGPGATNMITGAAAATINRLPVLLLPSDYYATRYQGPVLQQLEHPISADVSVNDCFRPVSRFFDRILRPEQLLTALPEAMRVLTDPVETGAVTIALPQDVQAEAFDYPSQLFEERVWEIERPMPDPRRINEAATLLRGAKRPMAIAGGGVMYSGAERELREFAEAFGIPVGETMAGHGVMGGASAMALGGHGTNGTSASTKLASRADLVLAIGTRLTDITTGSRTAFENPDVRFVHINVSRFDAHKMGALAVVGDAREALRSLTSAAHELGVRRDPQYQREIVAAKAAWDREVKENVFRQIPGESLTQGQLVGILNGESQPGDTVINDAGTLPGDLHKLWDVRNGTTCHLEFGYSTMGYALPASLGVRMAQPKGEVYVFVGDATFLMSPSELVTAMQEGLKVTVVISDNHGLQSIRGLQMGRAGRSFGNEFRRRDPGTNRLEGDYLPLDLARTAEGMGARTWHARTSDEVRTALREARTETRSCVIVVETQPHRYGPDSGAWWDVPVAETTRDMVTQKLRAQYEEKRKQQRFHG